MNVLEYMGKARSQKIVGNSEAERIRVTQSLFPSDINRVLEVGCGDGRITKFLREKCHVTGLDYAMSSAKSFGRNGIRGSAHKLPFKSQSFDLVICCEVLEHLPDDIFWTTLEELQRVSKKYILVSVPYQEMLEARYIRCFKCSTIFHKWGHIRTFSDNTLDSNITKFYPAKTVLSGKRPPYRSRLSLFLNQKFGNRWAHPSKTTICPNCVNTDFTVGLRNIVTTTSRILNIVLNAVIPKGKANWIFKLYTLKEN